jgi:type IV pilus assembly protein PilB
LQGASTAELKSEAIRLGMATLRRAGLNKVLDGMTTLEEVLRVTASD